MSTNRTACRKCGKRFRYLEEQRGSVVACPHCGEHRSIPFVNDLSVPSVASNAEPALSTGRDLFGPHSSDATVLDIDGMDGLSFEDLVFRLLVAMGFEVEQTSKGADAGVDILVRSQDPVTGGLFLVQCKRYSSNVGEPVLRDLYGAVLHAGAAKGILVTNAEFTRPARDFAQGKPLELIDGQTLRVLLQKHGINARLPEGHVVSRLPQGCKIMITRLQDVAASIRKELDRDRVLSAVGRKPYSLGDFMLLMGEASGTDVDVSDLGNVLSDLGGTNVERICTDPPDMEFLDSRLGMIDRIVRRILKQRGKVHEARIGEEYADLKKAAVSIYDSILDQFATFIENDVANALKLDGAVLPDNPSVKVSFEPKLDPELLATFEHEAAKASRHYQSQRRAHDSTAHSNFGAYLIAGVTILLLLFAAFLRLLRLLP